MRDLTPEEKARLETEGMPLWLLDYILNTARGLIPPVYKMQQRPIGVDQCQKLLMAMAVLTAKEIFKRAAEEMHALDDKSKAASEPSPQEGTSVEGAEPE